MSITNQNEPRVIVVGGGIGGLAAALALARQNVRVLLLEQADKIGEIGAGIQLGPNAFNALDALGAGGRITVTTMVTTAGAQITVADDGPGMSAEDRERAFLRFTTSNPNGTGLGLAIVHRLVTSNGGMARLTETPGGGLTVVLDFPGVPTANGGGAPESASSAQDFISL